MASEEALVEIARHLRSAVEGLPGAASRTEGHLTRSPARLEGLLGGALPVAGIEPARTPVEHLWEASALAEEHLGPAGLEGRVRWAIGEALSAAGEEIGPYEEIGP